MVKAADFRDLDHGSHIRWLHRARLRRVLSAVGWSVTLKCAMLRRSCASTMRTNRTRNVAVGTVKKSIDTSSPTRLSGNALRFCDGGLLLLGIQRDTVRSEMSIPSFKSSPCTLGAPHNGLDFAILRISSRISRSFPGRPGPLCPDRRVQQDAKRLRCQRAADGAGSGRAPEGAGTDRRVPAIQTVECMRAASPAGAKQDSPGRKPREKRDEAIWSPAGATYEMRIAPVAAASAMRRPRPKGIGPDAVPPFQGLR